MEHCMVICEIGYPGEQKGPSYYLEHCFRHELTRVPEQEEIDRFKLLSANRKDTFFSFRMNPAQRQEDRGKIVFRSRFRMDACLVSGIVEHTPESFSKEHSIHIHAARYSDPHEIHPDMDSITGNARGLRTFETGDQKGSRNNGVTGHLREAVSLRPSVFQQGRISFSGSERRDSAGFLSSLLTGLNLTERPR